MRFLQKHRAWLGTAAVFTVCFLIFAVFWQLDVRSASEKSRSAYLNDRQDAQTQAVTTSIEQTFFSDTPFHALGLLPFYKEDVVSGTLLLTVYDGAGNQLADPVQGNAAETHSGTYAVFALAHPVESSDGTYRLHFEAQLKNSGDEFSLTKSQDSLPGWELTENGKAAQGSLCILAAVDAIGNFASLFYWAFALCASAALAALFFLAQGKKVTPAGFFACCLGTVGLLSCFLLPPYAAPREEAHINRTFNLSSRMMGQWDGPIADGSVVRRASDQDVAIQQNGTTIFTYRELSRGLFSKTTDPTPTEFSGSSTKDSPLFHLPAALGLSLARLLGLGLVPALYLGRLFSLAAYVALAALAVKTVPLGKGVLGIAALLPLSLNLGASYNTTGLVLATAMLALALCLRATQKATLALGDLVTATAALLALCTAGIGYLPAALLLIPMGRKPLFSKGQPLANKTRHSLFLACFLLCIAAGVGSFCWYGQQAILPTIPTFSVQEWFKVLLGGILGDFNLSLNWGLTFIAAVLLAFSCLLPQQATPLPQNTRRWLAVVAAASLLLLAWAGGFHVEYAVYALPALPFLFYFLYRPWGGLTKKHRYTYFTFTAFSFLAVFSLLDAFLLTLTR